METIGLPITNTAIIGSLVKATGLISLESLDEPFHKRFGRLSAKNLEAMRRAYEQTDIIEHNSYESNRPASNRGGLSGIYQDRSPVPLVRG